MGALDPLQAERNIPGCDFQQIPSWPDLLRYRDGHCRTPRWPRLNGHASRPRSPWRPNCRMAPQAPAAPSMPANIIESEYDIAPASLSLARENERRLAGIHAGGKLESAGEMREQLDMRRPEKLIDGNDPFQTITAVDENPRISRKTRRIAGNIDYGWHSRTGQISAPAPSPRRGADPAQRHRNNRARWG